MKKIIFVILIGLINSCIPYKSYIKKDTECDFDMTIREEEKVFDSRLKPLYLEDTDVDSTHFVMQYYQTHTKGYILRHKYVNSNINKVKYYSESKKIQSVYFMSDGIYIGKETSYDTLGNITKVIDHRQADKYFICYKEALNIVEKLKPKRDTIFGIDRGYKPIANTPDTLYFWRVAVGEINKEETGDRRIGNWWTYEIDAQTGRLRRKITNVYK